jgi:hypothetical protein
MGILADSLAATLAAIREEDQRREARVAATLARIDNILERYAEDEAEAESEA